MLDDVVLNIDRDKHVGTVELFWQGGARTVLPVRLNHSALKRTDTRVGLASNGCVHSPSFGVRRASVLRLAFGRVAPPG
jgi:hypothetical protein